jgi:hypothetical protein
VCDLINFLTTQEEKLHEQNKELASLQEITLSRLQKVSPCIYKQKELFTASHICTLKVTRIV